MLFAVVGAGVALAGDGHGVGRIDDQLAVGHVEGHVVVRIRVIEVFGLQTHGVGSDIRASGLGLRAGEDYFVSVVLRVFGRAYGIAFNELLVSVVGRGFGVALNAYRDIGRVDGVAVVERPCIAIIGFDMNIYGTGAGEVVGHFAVALVGDAVIGVFCKGSITVVLHNRLPLVRIPIIREAILYNVSVNYTRLLNER